LTWIKRDDALHIRPHLGPDMRSVFICYVFILFGEREFAALIRPRIVLLYLTLPLETNLPPLVPLPP
jgi:hypothetical protein